MTDRREFLQQGIALSAVPLVGSMAMVTQRAPVSRLPEAANSPGRHPAEVVFDQRFGESRAFGEEARRLGLPVHAISGDVTELWYDDLYHRWQAGREPIAGMTSVAALFCLEQLAFRHDRRVVFRADHVRQPDGRVAHRLHGPQHRVGPARPEQSAGAWPVHMARLLAQLPADPAGIAHLEEVTPAGGANDWVAPLASWVIAPRGGA